MALLAPLLLVIALRNLYPIATARFAEQNAATAVLLLASHRRLYAIDDYVSMSYPNIFLIILLSQVLEDPQVEAVATWYLLPMFALVAIDELFHERLLRHQPGPHLKAFLGIEDSA